MQQTNTPWKKFLSTNKTDRPLTKNLIFDSEGSYKPIIHILFSPEETTTTATVPTTFTEPTPTEPTATPQTTTGEETSQTTTHIVIAPDVATDFYNNDVTMTIESRAAFKTSSNATTLSILPFTTTIHELSSLSKTSNFPWNNKSSNNYNSYPQHNQ